MAKKYFIYEDANIQSWRNTTSTGFVETEENLEEMSENELRIFFELLTDSEGSPSHFNMAIMNVKFTGGLIPPKRFYSRFTIKSDGANQYLEYWGCHANFYRIYLT